MTTIGVMINPGSHRNKSGIDDMMAYLDTRRDIHHRVLGGVGDIAETLRQFHDDGVDVLAVAGGDGTLQFALTKLIDGGPYDSLPTIAVLPRGRTNMTAADIGVRGRGARGLARLADMAARSRLVDHVVERHILCVENAKDHGPQYGMFFGGAGIWRAIEYTRNKIHRYDVGAGPTSAITFARLLARWIFLGRDDDELFHGDPVSITVDGATIGERSSLLILATTLEKLLLKSHPFWDSDGGPVAFTQISHPPHRLVRNAYAILYGNDRSKLPPDKYFSRGGGRVTLGMESPFTIDGAYFEPQVDREIVLTADHKAGFVCL